MCLREEKAARRKVALILYRDDPASGGSLRVGETLARFIDPARFEVHLVFAYGGPGPVAGETPVECHFLNAPHSRHPGSWLRARRLLRQLKPDIVHFIDPVLWMNLAAAGLRFQKLGHVHGRLLTDYMTRRDRMLTRLYSRLCDGHVFISQGAARSFREQKWAPAARDWVVYNGIDVERFSKRPPVDQVRRELGIPLEARVLGMVCRITKHKGCLDALRILQKLEARWHLVFCGEGPYTAELRRFVMDRGLSSRVHFTGVLDDVRTAYAAIDGLLFLSRYEPFGLTMAEAMASGVPVFGLIGLGEYAEPENPLLTPFNAVMIPRAQPHNQEQAEAEDVIERLAARIESYGRDPEEFSGMIEQGGRWVAERFNARLQADRMLGVYDQLSDGRPAGTVRHRSMPDMAPPVRSPSRVLKVILWMTSKGFTFGLSRAARIWGKIVRVSGRLLEVRIGEIILITDLEAANERHLLLGFQEKEVFQFYAGVLSPGDIVLDVGANIGFHMAVAANFVGSTGQVIGFEPHPNLQERLERMIERNPRFEFRLYKGAAGECAGNQDFFLSSSHSLSSLKKDWNPSRLTGRVSVPVIPLDEFIDRELPGATIRVVKIDVEGYEFPVLRGLERNLQAGRIDYCLFEMTPPSHGSSDGRQEECLAWIQSLGFRLFVLTRTGPRPWDERLDPLAQAAPGYNFLAQRQGLRPTGCQRAKAVER